MEFFCQYCLCDGLFLIADLLVLQVCIFGSAFLCQAHPCWQLLVGP
jgi:hypothetical protein